MKLINPIFIVGKFFNQLMQSSDDNTVLNKMLKTHGPKIFINVIIVIAILAVIDYFNNEIISLLSNAGLPLLVEPEVFLTILSIILIAYPIISLLGKVEKIITNISDIISTKLIPGDTSELETKPLHRLLRNIVFVGIVLGLVAIIQPYITEISENEIFSIIISVIGFVIAIILIIDTIFVFHKLSHSHIMESLLKEDEKQENEK